MVGEVRGIEGRKDGWVREGAREREKKGENGKGRNVEQERRERKGRKEEREGVSEWSGVYIGKGIGGGGDWRDQREALGWWGWPGRRGRG